MTPITTLTACLTGIVYYTSVEEIKIANVMQNKVIYCGECEKFLYEDTDGFGICGKTNEKCYCGDKCHLIHGKAQWATTLIYVATRIAQSGSVVKGI